MSIEVTSKTLEPATNFDLYKDIFNKALEACVLCYLTRKLTYRAGIAYGGIAGVVQLLFSGIHQKIDEKAASCSMKKLNYTLSSLMPWALSGVILHQVFQKTGNEHLRVSSGMGFIIAIIQQVVGRSNMHLLPKDSNS